MSKVQFPPGQRNSKSPGGAANNVINLTSAPDTDKSPYKPGAAGTSRSPSVKSNEANITNGPDDGSRPGSRSSQPHPDLGARPQISEQVEQIIGKDLQIHPTPPPSTTAVGYDWKRRAAAFNNGAGGGGGADMAARVVAAVSTNPPTVSGATVVTVSTRADERQITRVSQPGPRLEPISPAGMPPVTAGPSTSAGGDKNLNPLDYVKNKIAEEMKKESLKRPAAGAENNDDSPRKKAKDDDPPPPESPGSPGEMVIDESARPESASPAAASKPSPGKPSQPPPPLPPPTGPRYEPLSDDE